MKVTSRYRLSIQNFRQRHTLKHTVNVNELGTDALPGSCRFRICIFSGVDRQGVEFISNKRTYKDTQVYILVQIYECN